MPLILIDDETQLQLIVKNIFKQNDFMLQFQFFLFLRFKKLNHSSIIFKTQYRMIKFIEKMMSNFFCADEFMHNENIEIFNRSFFLKIQIFFKKNFNVDFSCMIYHIRDECERDNADFSFNFVNVFEILNLIELMIEKKIVAFEKILIMIFYRIQINIYHQTIHNMTLKNFAMMNIKVRTIDNIQKRQYNFIIMNIVHIDEMKFLRLRNRVYVVCFRAKNDFVIVENFTNINKKHFFKHEHFSKIFKYFKTHKNVYKIKQRRSNDFFNKNIRKSDDRKN